MFHHLQQFVLVGVLITIKPVSKLYFTDNVRNKIFVSNLLPFDFKVEGKRAN